MTARNTVAIITPGSKTRPLWGSMITNTGAFAARSAKADLLWTPGGSAAGSGPQTDTTNGRLFYRTEGNNVSKILFAGTGADNAVAHCRVWRWKIISDFDGAQLVQGTPVFLCQVNVTLSAKVGIAGGIIDADTRYADTLAYPTSQAVDDGGLPTLRSRFFGPGTAGDTPVELVIDPVGDQLIEVELRNETSTGILGYVSGDSVGG